MKSTLLGLGKGKLIGGIAAVIVVAGGVYYVTHKGSSQYHFISVTKGSIAETVSVTGNTTPVESLSLGFEDGGTIKEVDADVGARVAPGDVIARLDTRDLQAQLAQAQANVDAETAKLNSLKAGAQPADIAASQAAVDKAVQDLANLYGNVADTLTAAGAKANDAVRNQLSPFFANPEGSNPTLTFSVNNAQSANDAVSARILASSELNAWQKELANIGPNASSQVLEAALATGSNHLVKIGTLMTAASNAIVNESNLDTTTLNAYKTALATAIGEVSDGSASVSGSSQGIASQKLTVKQLQAQLDLKQAGASTQDVAAQQALVEQAAASAESIQIKIAKASLTSPITGVITIQNAKVGQIAAPGATLVSIISSNNLEVDANVPETDIGKLAVNDPVTMTFDAFPNETFTGKLFYIDPAETIIQGVVDYKIKVNFDKVDPRVKSGLTANLDIQTESKDNALILPQFAVLQNDQGTFVEVLQNGNVTQVPVTLGLRDQKGNVEIASGVTEGEQVLNIGLK